MNTFKFVDDQNMMIKFVPRLIATSLITVKISYLFGVCFESQPHEGATAVLLHNQNNRKNSRFFTEPRTFE